MKSSDQQSFGSAASSNGVGFRDGRRFFGLIRRFNSSSLYTRYTRLWFQGFRGRSQSNISPKPQRGRLSASRVSASTISSSDCRFEV